MAESRSPVGANIALYKVTTGTTKMFVKKKRLWINSSNEKGEMVYLRFLKVSGLDTFAIKNKTVRVIATVSIYWHHEIDKIILKIINTLPPKQQYKQSVFPITYNYCVA